MADQQTETTVNLDELEARLAALPNPDAQMLFTAGEVRWLAGRLRVEGEARRSREPQVWVCGQGHLVAIPADTPPYEFPACPWCEVDRLRGLVRTHEEAARRTERLCARATGLRRDPAHCAPDHGRRAGDVILDLFAGARGWGVGLRVLGLREVGIEIDRWACATAAAAGFASIRGDVGAYPPEAFAGRVEGLIASPPCQDFSAAGRRAGVDGETGRLVFEVMRWADALRPVWIACEQVPPVLPIWRDFARQLRRLGYSAWAGLLNAANFGVPQTRLRAFLLAHRERPALPPEPTHCRGGREADLFGRALLPWVSMAEALGWDGVDRPGRTVAGNRSPRWSYPGNATTGWTLHTNRGQRLNGDRLTVAVDRPAPSVTSKTGGQWVLRGNQIPDRASSDYQERPVEQPAQSISTQANLYRWAFVNGNQAHAAVGRPHEPAPTIHFGHNLNEVAWVAERPATTVQRDARIGRPGHKDRAGGEAQFAEECVRVGVVEAAILQGFPADYPWQGTKTKQFQQVGNAIPPALAAAVVGALTGRGDLR